MKNKFQLIALSLLAVVAAAALLLTTTTVQAQPNAQATATPTAHEHEEDEDEDQEDENEQDENEQDENEQDEDDAHEYCEQEGGTVVERYPTYNTNAAEAQWLRLAGEMEFCTFYAPADSTGFQSQISIGLETLYAEDPTLAVLAYMEPVAMPAFTGANPSTLYCQKLGGTDIWGGQNNGAGGGWVTEDPDSATNFQVVGMCVFPDMSVIDSWGLTYKANGVVRGTDLTTVVRYQPTDPPVVFFGAKSPNQPAENTVDKTVTNADNGTDVELAVGDILTVNLDANPSTGDPWQVTEDDDDILLPVGDSQFNVRPNVTPMPGTGGTQTFNFKAVGKGSTTLTLVYMRPWETDTTPTPQNTWTVDVTVE